VIVVAWNMAKRRGAWRHLLDGLAPDLALLQETPPPPTGVRPEQFVHDENYVGPSLGSVVYVKDARARELELPPEHRVWFTAVEVEWSDALSLVAVSVHTPTDPVRPFNDRAFEALGPHLADRSFIVGGDFNLSRNYDRVYGTSHHTEFLDALPDRGFVDCMRKFYAEEQRTFWGRTKYAYQNDHVFVSADLGDGVVACEVADRANLSDHSPLTLTLDLAVLQAG
jgi:hypothetical protein